MKRILAMLLLAGSVAHGAIFQSAEFLNVQSLVITNTVGYTNTIPYLGITGAYSTNAAGLIYTNSIGVQVTTIAGATAGTLVVTNGQITVTNDATFICRDISNESDVNGNVHTNYNWSFSLAANSTTTNNIIVVMYPVLKGPLSGGPGGVPTVLPWTGGSNPEIIDLSNPLVFNIGTLRGGTTNVTAVPISGATPAGALGWRLQSVTATNAGAAVIIYDISRNTFKP